VCTSRQHTVRYTVGNTHRSVGADFFKQGNQIRRHYFSRPDLYLFHFNERATSLVTECLYKTDRCYAFDEWQVTQLHALSRQYNVMNGFVCMKLIPPGSTVLVNLCHPDALPLTWLEARHDLTRVCYTLESPNYRHTPQWSRSFLSRYFDKILTYWEPLLSNTQIRAHFCPHNTHWLDLSNATDRAAGLRVNECTKPRSVCCVLERRDGQHTYEIDGVRLQQLDGMREKYVRDLPIDLYGMGWQQADLGPDARVVRTNHKGSDVEHAVDVYQRYSFAVVIENCDAANYVSEKIFDCFSAGCIPIYYGNNSVRVDIPDDIYIDLRRFASSTELHDFLQSLTDSAIDDMRDKLYKRREEVLRKVDTDSFARHFVASLKD